MDRTRHILISIFFSSIAWVSTAGPKDSLLLILKSHPYQDTVRVNVLNELSRLYRNVKPDSAWYFASQALDLSRTLDFAKGEAMAFNYLGSIRFYEGNYAKADSFQALAIQLCIEKKLPGILANAYNSAGLSKQYQDNYVESVTYYLKALDLHEQNKNLVGQVKVMVNLGSVYRKLGDLKQSIDYYLRANTLNKTLPRKEQVMGGIASNIGNYYAYINKYDDALTYYLQALQENTETNNPYNITLSNNNIGFCYLQMRKPKEAAPYVELAYKNSEKQNVGNIQSLILLNMGSLRLLQKRTEEALRYSEQGLVIALQKKEKDRELIGYRNLAEIFQSSGAYQKAARYYEKAYQLNDSLHNNEITNTIGGIQKGYELAKKQNEINLLSQEAKIKSLELDREKSVKYFLYFGIFVLLSVSGLIGYNVYHKNILNRKLREQNHNIETQKKIIEVINQSLEEKASRAQMNPHFIFNSLNSIQYLIVNKNNDEAFRYLVSFSTLLRGLLEFSDRKTISLKEEIEMLTLYLQLESLRFENNFSYSITPGTIDTEGILLPPLLLQPFVENAIVHGLLHKKEDRRLNISFTMESSTLTCTIADNGIGRVAASQNKKLNNHHTSRAMAITRDRLIVFNHSTEEPLIIEDLYDQPGQPAGTSVTLKFINVA